MDALTPPPSLKPARPVGLYISIGVGLFILAVIAATILTFVSSGKNDLNRIKTLQQKLAAEGVVFQKDKLLAELPPKPPSWCRELFDTYDELLTSTRKYSNDLKNVDSFDLSQPKDIARVHRLLDSQREQLIGLTSETLDQPLDFPFDWKTGVLRTFAAGAYTFKTMRVMDGIIILDATEGRESNALSLLQQVFQIDSYLVQSPEYVNNLDGMDLALCNLRATESVVAHATSEQDLKTCQSSVRSISLPNPLKLIGGTLAAQMAALDFLANPQSRELVTSKGKIPLTHSKTSLYIINSVKANVYQRAQTATTLFLKNSTNIPEMQADFANATRSDTYDLLAAIDPINTGLPEYIQVGGMPLKMWKLYCLRISKFVAAQEALDMMIQAETVKKQSGDFPSTMVSDNLDHVKLPPDFRVHYDFDAGEPVIWSGLGEVYGTAPDPDPDGFLAQETLRIDLAHPTTKLSKDDTIIF